MQNKKNLIIWAIVGVIVLLLAAGMWLTYATKGEPTGSENEGATASAEETAGPAGVAVEVRSTDVLSIARGVSNGATFVALLTSTGVGSTIKGAGPYTIFVPTDGAFSRVAPGTISRMSVAQKKRLMQYHLVSGRALDVDAVDNGQIQAVSGDMLNFFVDSDSGKAFVNSGYVLAAYKGSNGMVYVVNTVLLPPVIAR